MMIKITPQFLIASGIAVLLTGLALSFYLGGGVISGRPLIILIVMGLTGQLCSVIGLAWLIRQATHP